MGGKALPPDLDGCRTRERRTVVTESPMPPVETNLWLSDLRCRGRMAVLLEEIEHISHAIDRADRRNRRAHQVTRWTLEAALVAVSGVFFVYPGETVAITFFAAIGMAMLVLGALSTLLEVVFGSWVARLVFLVAVIVAIGAESLGSELLGVTVATVCGALALALLLLRLASRSRLLRALDLGRRDLDMGESLVFEREASPQVESEDPDETCEDELPYKLAYVLPTSWLLYRTDDRLIDELELVDAFVFDGRAEGDSPAVRQAEVVRVHESTRMSERQLSGAEVTELTGAQRRLIRHMVLNTLLWAWCVALVMRVIEQLLHGEPTPYLSATGWCVVVAVALARGGQHTSTLRSYSSDLRNQTVFAFHQETPDREQFLEFEVLPKTEFLWTVRGIPAEWRARHQPPVRAR